MKLLRCIDYMSTPFLTTKILLHEQFRHQTKMTKLGVNSSNYRTYGYFTFIIFKMCLYFYKSGKYLLYVFFVLLKNKSLHLTLLDRKSLTVIVFWPLLSSILFFWCSLSWFFPVISSQLFQKRAFYLVLFMWR